VKTVMNLRGPYKAGKFLSSCVTGGFSRRAQLREVRCSLDIRQQIRVQGRAFAVLPTIGRVSKAVNSVRMGLQPHELNNKTLTDAFMKYVIIDTDIYSAIQYPLLTSTKITVREAALTPDSHRQ
jgi:hypothetical protein